MLVFCTRFIKLSGTKASGDTGEFIKAIRPVFLCVMLAFVPQMLTLSHFNQYPVLRKITAQIIMGLDYREQSVCGETKPKAARIDEHRSAERRRRHDRVAAADDRVRRDRGRETEGEAGVVVGYLDTRRSTRLASSSSWSWYPEQEVRWGHVVALVVGLVV